MSVRNDGVSNFDTRHYDVGVSHGMGLNTTTFGVFDDGKWSFYYQTYASSGLKYVLRTFRMIDVNNLRA